MNESEGWILAKPADGPDNKIEELAQRVAEVLS
jgi:hypothetical protein